MIHYDLLLTGVERDFISLEVINYLEFLSARIQEFFSSLFPILLCITVVTVNLSIILGAIIYLLDYNEENGKMMILRSLAILTLLIFIFTPNFPDIGQILEPFEEFQSIAAYITAYLLFVFASLSLIVFLGNLGLYIISSDAKRKKTLKKSIICLLCVIFPLGFQFPNMPIWRT